MAVQTSGNVRGKASVRGGQGAKANPASGRTPAASAPNRATGERDENYNLISVLYHALQGAETYGQYIRDAQQAGDDELAEFFGEIQEEERDRAERAKELLSARLGGEADYDDDDDDLDDED